jgi:UPF0288 family protein (methanogenesis marker protein 3)
MIIVVQFSSGAAMDDGKAYLRRASRPKSESCAVFGKVSKRMA